MLIVFLGYFLQQNYPNLFSAGGGSAYGGNPSTKIRFTIGAPPNLHKGEAYVGTSFMKFYNVILKIYDLLGNEIITLVNEEKTAERYEVMFFGSVLLSGFYIYRLVTPYFSDSKKLMLLK